MSLQIKHVDIVCGLAWGDEAKGKIVSNLIETNNYDWVCRWSGSHNAGHTIFVNGEKFVTHIIPAGVFHGVNSLIGPDCLVNISELKKEMFYLSDHGIDLSKLYISSNVNIITENHKLEDKNRYMKTQGSTGKGVAPCARDKYARTGTLLSNLPNNELSDLFVFNKNIIFDIKNLYGNILCEGAQGNWLDINFGNYPYVTSANTLPYTACSLGFSPRKIRDIYGATKIYDTRVGVDPDFTDDLLKDNVLSKIAEVGSEFGATTGRTRKVNWLNLDKLIDSINISGSNKIIISKVDILEKINVFKVIYDHKTKEFDSLNKMIRFVNDTILNLCSEVNSISFSNNPYSI